MPDEETLDLTPLVKTRLAWDLIEHDKVREWLPRLGLTPAGDESFEMDHVACHHRAVLVEPLADLIGQYSALAAGIHARYVMHGAEGDFSPEERDEARDQYAVVAFRLIESSALSIIAEFLQDGFLTYGPACVRGEEK
jgi:hypothetical protein